MSLGDYGPRAQAIFLSLMFGLPVAMIFWTGGHRLAAAAVGALVLAHFCYQAGRTIEKERMEKRKWYREGNYDQIE